VTRPTRHASGIASLEGGTGSGSSSRLPSLGVQRGDQVYAAVRDSILSGRYAPGSKLVIEDIAGALGVSITPVRDALARLESHGLVKRVPYQGSFVKQFDIAEVRALYEVRAGLECLAVTLACARISEDQLAELRNAQQGGVAALGRNDLDAYREHNHVFHAIILEAAANPLLIDMMNTIKLQMQMAIARTIQVPGRPDRAVKEHLELVERLEQRDTAGAERVMKRHVFSALEDLVAGIERSST
jgi:DNA-binding GntR family transcriptional regulator